MIRLLAITMILANAVQPVWAGELIEIQLMHKLDDLRGFCIDIRGHKERAKVKKGLQAHTCYSYQGQISVDQAFDAKLVSQGEFNLPFFGVCMEAEDVIEGSHLNLNTCTDISTQKFRFTSNNQNKLISNDELCVAIDGTNSKQGGGGTPPHLLRALFLKNCEKSGTKYTTWRMNEQDSQ